MAARRRRGYVPGATKPFDLPATLIAGRVFPLVLAVFFLPQAPWWIRVALDEPGVTSAVVAVLVTLAPAGLLPQVFRPARLELSSEGLVFRMLRRELTLRWDWVEEFSVVSYAAGYALVRQVAVRLNAEGQDQIGSTSFTISSNRASYDVDFTISNSRFGQRSYAELAARLNATLEKYRSV